MWRAGAFDRNAWLITKRVLGFTGGTRNLEAGSDVAGGGTLSVSGGTVNADAALSIAATGAALTVSGGTLNVNTASVSGLLVPVTASGGALDFNGAAVVLPSLLLAGGTLGGTAAVTVAGSVNVTVSGSMLSGTGSFTTLGATTISTPSGNGFLAVNAGKSWVNQGTITVGGDERIFFGYFNGGTNSLTNALGGSIVLASTYSAPLELYTGSASVTNLGTLTLTATGSHSIDSSIAFSNSGTVSVTTGTLSIGGGGTDSGVYAVAAGTTLIFSSGTRTLAAGSDVTGGGTLNVSGGTVNANGSLSLASAGTALIVSGGTLNVNTASVSGLLVPVTASGGALDFNASAVILPTVVLSGGALGGTASITVAGSVNVTVSGSMLSGTGSFTTLGATTISTPSGNGFLAVNAGKSWVNQGTITVGGDERIFFGYFNGGTNSLTNALGGSIVLASTYSAPLELYTGSASVTNLGTLTLTATGSHSIDSSIAFSNSGTVSVTTGTLSIGGGGTDSGLYSLATGTGLDFSGGSRTLGTGADVSGPGTLTIGGATVNANVPLSLAAQGTALVVSSGTLSFNAPTPQTVPSLVLGGGTLTGTGDVTVTGTFNVTVSTSLLSGTERSRRWARRRSTRRREADSSA